MSGGLESIAAAQQDVLIPGLNFKLPQGASYVSQRRMATFFPQGSNIYSPQGTRLIRFVISDATNLLDLSTFRLAFRSSTMTQPSHCSPPATPDSAGSSEPVFMWADALWRTSFWQTAFPAC